MSRVTVVMPVYKAEQYIGQAIDSILGQTYTDFELLLIDDVSPDHILDVMKGYTDPRIRFVRNEKNLGIAGTRNLGIELSRSEYIALMDDDDIAVPNRLEKEVDFLDGHPDMDVVGGHLRMIDKDGKDLQRQWSVCNNPKYIKAYLLLGNIIANGTVMFRKSLTDRYHIRYQDNFYGAEDYRFWVDCSLHGSIANLDEVLLYWRTGHNNETGRVRSEKNKEREETISRIHRYALEQSGFRLTDDELNVLNAVFKEEGILHDKEELGKLYGALKTIASQAEGLKLDHAEEIITMCRKRFGEKVGKAFFLWEKDMKNWRM